MAQTILTLLLLLVLTTAGSSQPFSLRNPTGVNPATPSSGGGADPTYILKENFEGTGYDSTNVTWTEFTSTGTVNEDYTTTALEGSQSLSLVGDAPNCGISSTSWTYVEPFYIYFMLRVSSLSGGDGTLVQIKEGGTVAGRVQMSSAGQLRADGDAASPTAYTTGALTTNTTYHVWVKFDTSVSPCAWEISFSTDGTKPTSGSNFMSGTSEVTTGASAVGIFVPAPGVDVIVDKLRVDDVPIGSNPT